MKRTNTTQPRQSDKKKLELTRESIRPLTEETLEDVVGGIRVTTVTSRQVCDY